MARELTVDQVLEVAQRMERNAVLFYRRAAGACDDAKICRLFVDLARWERQHVRVFAEMRERLSDLSEFSRVPQSRELERFVLDAIDPSPTEPPLPLVFGDRERPSNESAGGWTRTEVLKTAIRKEKDTISYFTNLKEFVPGHHNSRVIEALIREEEQHVRILSQSLEQPPESLDC